MARRFDKLGQPSGGDLAVSNPSLQELRTGVDAVSVDEAGNFVVVWSGGVPVRGQRFDSLGARRGASFSIGNPSPFAVPPVVQSDAAGNFVVAWGGFDYSAAGITARRYGGLLPAALAVDAGGNGVLEPGEAVDVRPSWRNANGAVQTFGGMLSALTGPSGLTYTLTDAVGDYGAVPDATVGACTDCYGVSVSNPPVRPQTHIDASVLEAITPDVQGQMKRWGLHVGDSFSDVPRSSPFYRFVETLLHHSVTGGCTATAYCPGSATSREQMAVFVLVATEGSGYIPPACGATPMFSDVAPGSPFCRWIEELARRGVVAGCGPGIYCPAAAVSREQMAVFVLRTLDPSANPAQCAPPNLFADVPETSPFCRWVEDLANRAVVTGCGGGNYCPTASVTREQMGVFISLTFGLALYGP
jgi:hypothetical protein